MNRAPSFLLTVVGLQAPQAGRLLLAFTLLCSTHTAAQAQVPPEMKGLGRADVGAPPVASSMSRLTLYSPLGQAETAAVLVYLNGRFHTMLKPGMYSDACVKAGSVQVGLRHLSPVGRDGLQLQAVSTTELRTPGGQQQIFRLSDKPGPKWILQAVSRQDSAAELAKTRAQVHTLSRSPAVVMCQDASPMPPVKSVLATSAPAPVALPAAHVLTLLSDAMFHPGKSALSDLLPGDRSALDRLIARVKTQYVRIDSIVVTGHADPIGPPARNRAISHQRAQAVMDYLSASGLKPRQMTIQGRADQELIAKTCGNAPTAANSWCHQPNRRVSLEISGTPRTSP